MKRQVIKWIRNFTTCIVGSGPSGFSVASHLLKHNENVRIEMLEKLFSPFGLVRYGVAPDHQDVKAVVKNFEKTAYDPRFLFWGNVEVGKDVSLSELLNLYDCVVLCYGRSEKKLLNIPGEVLIIKTQNLPNIFSSSEIVGWYNTNPDYTHVNPDLRGSDVVIVGNGNAAIDVTRVLACNPSRLEHTDINFHALKLLEHKRIRTFYVVGRRSPYDASFSTKEIRMLKSLSELSCKNAEPIQLGVPTTPQRNRLISLLQSFEKDHTDSPTKINFIFHKIIQKIQLSSDNKLILFFKDSRDNSDYQITADMVVHCIGYNGFNIDKLVPFDDNSGTIINCDGRVDVGSMFNGKLYCAGWIKNGSKGYIADTLYDSQKTASVILDDFSQTHKYQSKFIFDSFAKSRGLKPISFGKWKKLETEEIRHGAKLGKIREKLTQTF